MKKYNHQVIILITFLIFGFKIQEIVNEKIKKLYDISFNKNNSKDSNQNQTKKEIASSNREKSDMMIQRIQTILPNLKLSNQIILITGRK